MSYIVNFTDKDNKTPITVFDNTSNTETSVVLPGRNIAGYGQIIAENFLHILENFAGANPPSNPVEGQLWYDIDSGVLQIFDNVSWKAASNIQKGPVQPNVSQSAVGELWVDTTNQQLRIFTGSRWILVGPLESFRDGQRFGPALEDVADTDGINRVILTFYIADIPVIIFSKDSFTPRTTITGFSSIRSGINVNAPQSDDIDNFLGGFLPKLNGIATSADGLAVGTQTVPSNRFLRSDTANTTDFRFSVRNNSGISIGTEGTFRFSTTATSAQIYNAAGAGNSIDLQLNDSGRPSTIVSVKLPLTPGDSGVDIRAPISIDGGITATGNLLVNSTNPTSSIRSLGGANIAGQVECGPLTVNGNAVMASLTPKPGASKQIGSDSNRWTTIYADTIVANTIDGALASGVTVPFADTASALDRPYTFKLEGDVQAAAAFDTGNQAGETILQTTLTSDIIANKPQPFPNRSKENDFVLTFRPQSPGQQSGLFRQSRDAFVSDLGVPIGAIMPYAGQTPPEGYLLCDGSEIDRQQYPDLFAVIGTQYTGPSPLQGIDTFRLPDLRGRFGLGRDNMTNGLPAIAAAAGGFVSPGGGNVDRVPDANADILGASGGQSSTELTLNNLPEHSHTLRNGNTQYSVVRVDPSINPPASTGLGPTAFGQAQYFNDSGGIRAPSGTEFGAPIGLINPYLTLNYIIRTGIPTFTL